MISYLCLPLCVLQVVLSNFLRHIWQLKHFLCHLAPAQIISSAWYTLSVHRGHLPGPSANVAFGGILRRRQTNKTLKEFNTSLVGSQLRVKLKAGYGMRGLLMAGCGIKIFFCEWDLIISDGIRDSCKIDGRMRIKCGKSHENNQIVLVY